MKKYFALIAIAALATNTYASEVEEDEKGWEFSLGGGVAYELSPYQGVGNETEFIPMWEASYGDLYLEGTELGYEIWENEKWSTTIFTSFGEGYEVSGSDLGKGYDKIEDRDGQVEGGLEIGYDLGNDYEVSLRTAFGSEGNRYSLEGEKLFFVSDKTTIRTGLSFTFNDSSYTEYYFGVTEKEANRAGNYNIDKAYKPGSSYTVGFEVGAEHKLTESFTLIAMAEVEHMSGDINDSPIVENSLVYEIGTGLKYTF